jgi:hypothetical protein
MKRTPVFVLALAAVCSAALYDDSLTVNSSYINNTWGKAYVLKNDLCTLSIMPDIGGRVMSYCLGTHNFSYVIPGENKNNDPSFFTGGGFMTWPAPQDTFGWPPTPILSSGKDTVTVVSNTADSVVILLKSKAEVSPSKAVGLVFRKMYTFYKASSRVKVDVRLVNTSASTITQTSIREVAPVLAQHNNSSDWSNFHAYFPKGTSPQDGTRGFWNTMGSFSAEQFTVDNTAGVVDFRYSSSGHGARIAAHPASQWLAYQDSLEGYTFVQKALYQPTATYLEYGGAVIIMYLDSWIEAELCSPGKDIAPNDSLQFVSNWYATKLAGAVRAVNNAGAIKDSLFVNALSGTFTGTYGVFHQGTVKICFNGQTTPAKEIPVSPLATFTLNDTVTIPASSGTVSLLLYNSDGVFVDTLDSKVFRTVATEVPASSLIPRGVSVGIHNNKLRVTVPGGGDVKVRLTSLSGKTVIEAAFAHGTFRPIDLSELAPGNYLVTVETGVQRYAFMVPVFVH